MENDKPILCGPPASKAKQLELGIAEYIPALGSLKVPCVNCGEVVWLGLNQQSLLKDGGSAMCWPCVVPFIKPEMVRHAGGVGGSYKTTSGHTFGPKVDDHN